MQDLENILTKFQEIVSQNFCYNLAIRTGLIKRSSSQLNGHEFAQALVVPNAFLESESLNSLAARMQRINPECNLSAPALAQRINTENAELFMKQCFSMVLREVVQKSTVEIGDLKNFKKFKRILIEDSTMIELNENASSIYRGRGGAASKAAVKINYIFDYLSEKTIEVKFTSGNTPDQKLAGRIIPLLAEDDLVIRDLGYFVLQRIKEIEDKKAFYVSRFKSNIDVYESIDSTKTLDLAKHIDKCMCNGITDIEVFLGKEKQRVRLVACLMSEEAINQRRRNANRTAQRCGRQLSKKKLALLKYSIFITNISAEEFSSKEIMAVYRVRWRVELIFKQWKSCLKIHIFKGYRLERLRCLLYGRLIMILLLGAIIPLLMKYALTMDRELSCYKLMNYFIADHVFAMAIQEGRLKPFIDRLIEDIPRRLCMDKRERRSLRENARLGVSYYNDQEYKELQKNVA
jgi:IS4 transposase